ncbi:MAG: CusA/CzcA family heavy metal efflux RND transporter [Gemmatimonadota bacterium]|nr:CusA/CzcA family heavy metal efflux RND transporter [Gemmatimonadota bacterium]MDH3366852.1 CusA/CzcA family heavy metal efflux RND transporter [Gemmatimonadota bacterium]MDH3478595.1 CusA/CzcA family heavy metal efflux RND transporter [Gemmatimonadota bacterium]MDH5548359.1 CusA/CzcA family heavy metal efflux RND transporter [Gemmatimonadota bacterium]
MISAIIGWSLRNRGLVLLATVALVGGGVWAMRTTPLDAIPDLSDVQVIIQTDFAEQAPQIVEDQVTYPITSEMLKVPGARVVRGYSFFGLSLVYVIFEDGTDIYWARSRVLEYLNGIRQSLPRGVEPTLGPDATGVGWVFEYVLESDSLDLAQLRTMQDWYLRYQLTSVPGVSEVASVGGFVKQYQVEVNPERLRAFNIPVTRVVQAVGAHNVDIGARVLEMGGREYMIRGLGYLGGISDIENVTVGATMSGTPIRVGDVATVQIGPAPRRGAADLDGKGEVVAGIVVMRFGSDALQTIERVKKRLVEIERGLPPGVRLRTAYDRSDLIHRAIATLRDKLLEESLIVAAVAVVFLLHVRSALVAIITLPLGILISFIVMRLIGVNANIMSLGGIAIAIGAMVDAAIVMIENMHKHLERAGATERSRWEIVLESAKQVGPPLFFSLLIITFSFLPVFALEQQEGRLFKPLAYTKTFAMAGSALLSITLVPVLMGYLIRGRIRSEAENPLNRGLQWAYRPVIDFVLHRPWTIVATAALVLAVSVIPWRRLGSEFMPQLHEGSILFMPTTVPGVSIAQAREIMRQQDSVLAAFPEVVTVLGKAGRAETATDPAPLDMFETTITLKPESEWRSGLTYDELIREMDRAVQMPGVTNAWTMPIKGRIDMLATGVRTAVGIKIFGPSLDTLQALGERVERIVQQVPGTRSAFAERGVSGYYVDIEVDRSEAARYGLNVGDVHDAIMATVGGMSAAITVEGRERYEVNVRYPRELRDHVDDLEYVLIPTMDGRQIPLGQLASIQVLQGPMAVKTENAFPVSTVFVDIEDRDVGSYVRDAQRVVSTQLSLPSGYTLLWSGQYEFMQRVAERMQIVVPVTLGIIFLLLYLNFRGVTESLIVMLSVPFALVGGVWYLWLAGYNTSVAVWVGFIALAGVAAETGVVMLIYLDEAFHRRNLEGRMHAADDVAAAVREGAVDRLRPKIMTVMAITLGLAPILWSHGTGADVMKRIAAPMVGGMVTSTILTLVVIPAIYLIWRRWEVSRLERRAAQS